MALDYERLMALMREGVPQKMAYVDLFRHAFDRRLLQNGRPLAAGAHPARGEKAGNGHGRGRNLPGEAAYESRERSPFYGGYWGQSALNAQPDTLVYLESEYTRNAVVTSAEKPGQTLPVYTLDRFEGMDGYDVFLDGAATILTIECKNAKTDRELILFRFLGQQPLRPCCWGRTRKSR